MLTPPATVTGNTYPVRTRLKALGGQWDKAAQGWRFETQVATDEALSIVAAAGPIEPHHGRRTTPRRITTRFMGGGEIYRNANGRCIDAPCCGCCS